MDSQDKKNHKIEEFIVYAIIKIYRIYCCIRISNEVE